MLTTHTRSSELGMDTHTDKVFNSFNMERSPAGSSGGAGSIACSGVVIDGVRHDVIATASDFGGSIRWPSAVHGLFGIKPTERVIYGGNNDAFGLSVHGVIARTPGLTAYGLDLLPKYQRQNMHFGSKERYPHGSIIASMLSLDPSIQDTHDDNKEAMGLATEKLQDDGFEVHEYESPLADRIEEIKETYAIIAAASSMNSILGWEAQGVRFDHKKGDIGKQTRILADFGAIYGDDLPQVLVVRENMKNDLNRWMIRNAVGAIMTPTLVEQPHPTASDMHVVSKFDLAALGVAVRMPRLVKKLRILETAARKDTPDAAYANYMGNPAATYNQLYTGVGVQLLGRKHSDDQLISTANILHSRQ